MRNSGKAFIFQLEHLDSYVVRTIRKGYMDAAINKVSDEYDHANINWQKNYEIGRLYAVEIMALGFKCPPWHNPNVFPVELENIIKLIQEFYKSDVIPADAKEFVK